MIMKTSACPYLATQLKFWRLSRLLLLELLTGLQTALLETRLVLQIETKPLKVTEAMVGNKMAVKDRNLKNRPISLLSRDLLNFPKTSDLLTKMEA